MSAPGELGQAHVLLDGDPGATQEPTGHCHTYRLTKCESGFSSPGAAQKTIPFSS